MLKNTWNLQHIIKQHNRTLYCYWYLYFYVMRISNHPLHPPHHPPKIYIYIYMFKIYMFKMFKHIYFKIYMFKIYTFKMWISFTTSHLSYASLDILYLHPSPFLFSWGIVGRINYSPNQINIYSKYNTKSVQHHYN